MSSARLPAFTLFRPQSIEDACSLVEKMKGEAMVIAGGTDLLIRMRQRTSTPQSLVSLNHIEGLCEISYSERTGLTIGSLATLSSLELCSSIQEHYPVLLQAIRQTSAWPLRQMGTVGGNLCMDTRCIFFNQSNEWRKSRPPCFKIGGAICHAVPGSKRCYAVYQGDLAPVLIALDARVRIKKCHSERLVNLNTFYTNSGVQPNVLELDEILTEIQVPPPRPHTSGSYQKLRVREAIDFPLAAVAAVLNRSGSTCVGARLVVGAIASAPIQAVEVEKLLTDRRIDEKVLDEAAEEAMKVVRPVDNLSIGVRYRQKMVKVLAKRALKEALSAR